VWFVVLALPLVLMIVLASPAPTIEIGWLCVFATSHAPVPEFASVEVEVAV
jgi:hypothetical protein